MNIEVLRQKASYILRTWGNSMLDDMAKSGKLGAAKPYIQRAMNNIISRFDSDITSKLDSVALFIADENGDVNPDEIISDLSEALCSMKPAKYDIAGVTVKAGGGAISIELPSNPITDLLLGEYRVFVIKPEDLTALCGIIEDKQ